MLQSYQIKTENEGINIAKSHGVKFISILPKLNIVLAYTAKFPIMVQTEIKNRGDRKAAFWNLLYTCIGQKPTNTNKMFLCIN